MTEGTGAQPAHPALTLLKEAALFVRTPLFFRAWVIWGGAALALWAARYIYWMGWAAQPIYLGLLWTTALTTSRDACARCVHYGTWHCGGPGKLTASLFPRLSDPIPSGRLVLHLILLVLSLAAMLLGLFYGSTVPGHGGMLPGILGLVWLAIAIPAALPRGRPFSWTIGRAEAGLHMAMARERAKEAVAARHQARKEMEAQARTEGTPASAQTPSTSSIQGPSIDGRSLEQGIPLLDMEPELFAEEQPGAAPAPAPDPNEELLDVLSCEDPMGTEALRPAGASTPRGSSDRDHDDLDELPADPALLALADLADPELASNDESETATTQQTEALRPGK